MDRMAHLCPSSPLIASYIIYGNALPAGWLVATNLNNVLKKTIIRLATEVAGLTVGKDVIVEF